MNRRLVLVPGLVAAVLLMSGCGGAVQKAANDLASSASAMASSAVAAASSAAADPSTPTADSNTPSDAPTPTDSGTPAAAGGANAEFCTAFLSLGAGSGTDADKMHQAATVLRDKAPSEIADAAKTYADALDAVAESTSGGAVNNTVLQGKLIAAVKDHPQDISTVALYIVKNCSGT